MTLFAAADDSTRPTSSPVRQKGGGADEKFRLLRSRLDQLGYTDVFSLDSMHLILRLLNDLVQTTESCRKLKLTYDKAIGDRRRAEGEVYCLHGILGVS